MMPSTGTLRPCPECHGARLRPESRAVLVGGTPIHEFTALSARRALEWIRGLELTDHDRRIARLVLREIEGQSYQEIAAALDIPEGTVKSRLSRARDSLKEKLQKYVTS